MTITKTVDIPVGRRLTIDVPREVPVGWTVLAFTPASEPLAADHRADSAHKNTDGRTSPLPNKLKRILSQPTPIADSLLGALSDTDGMTLEQIREERLAKHLK